MELNHSSGREHLDPFNWMADTTIPEAEPDRAIFFWQQDGLVNVALERWPLPAALSACRFLSHFLSLASYRGTRGLVGTTRDELVAKFALDREEAWNRAHVGWQIICYGLRDFQGTLSGLLLAHDEADPTLLVLASGVHYWAIHEAARCLPAAFPHLDDNRFLCVAKILELAADFLAALDWESRSLKAFDGVLSPYMNVWFVSDIAAAYATQAAR